MLVLQSQGKEIMHMNYVDKDTFYLRFFSSRHWDWIFSPIG